MKNIKDNIKKLESIKSYQIEIQKITNSVESVSYRSDEYEDSVKTRRQGCCQWPVHERYYKNNKKTRKNGSGSSR